MSFLTGNLTETIITPRVFPVFPDYFYSITNFGLFYCTTMLKHDLNHIKNYQVGILIRYPKYLQLLSRSEKSDYIYETMTLRI